MDACADDGSSDDNSDGDKVSDDGRLLKCSAPVCHPIGMRLRKVPALGLPGIPKETVAKDMQPPLDQETRHHSACCSPPLVCADDASSDDDSDGNDDEVSHHQSPSHPGPGQGHMTCQRLRLTVIHNNVLTTSP